ncbi:MAG: response regulator transcription factor [Anaerolineales bacterium]|nr:response regulator transcription factor [Anaerolineales bacterium]
MEEIMQRGPLVLIAAPPGWWRDGLQAIVRAMPQIQGVDRADDGPSALRMMAEHAPAVVLLDTDLFGNEVSEVLRQIKAKWPQTRCIVLMTSHSQQLRAVNQAGADAVLVKGFLTTTLIETLEKLLSSIGQIEGGN